MVSDHVLCMILTKPSAAAIANAIFDATGARIRQVPLTPQRIKAALAPMRR
jgi:nicotinate dehydrogenase subunit B